MASPEIFSAALLTLFGAAVLDIISDISAADAKAKISDGALVVDVRSAQEFADGHVRNALHIPYDRIEEQLDRLGSDKVKEIIVYCHSGRRSEYAKDVLLELGFTNVFNAGSYELLAE